MARTRATPRKRTMISFRGRVAITSAVEQMVSELVDGASRMLIGAGIDRTRSQARLDSTNDKGQ